MNALELFIPKGSILPTSVYLNLFRRGYIQLDRGHRAAGMTPWLFSAHREKWEASTCYMIAVHVPGCVLNGCIEVKL